MPVSSSPSKAPRQGVAVPGVSSCRPRRGAAGLRAFAARTRCRRSGAEAAGAGERDVEWLDRVGGQQREVDEAPGGALLEIPLQFREVIVAAAAEHRRAFDQAAGDLPDAEGVGSPLARASSNLWWARTEKIGSSVCAMAASAPPARNGEESSTKSMSHLGRPSENRRHLSKA